jgi:hypothetical protein
VLDTDVPITTSEPAIPLVVKPQAEPNLQVAADDNTGAVRPDGSLDVSQANITGGIAFAPVTVPTKDGRIIPGLVLRFPKPTDEDGVPAGFYTDVLLVLEDPDMERVGQKFKKACDSAMTATRMHRSKEAARKRHEAALALVEELTEAPAEGDGTPEGEA